MPVTIRQATIGFKDENGNYIRTNSLVEQTTSNQIQAIQQAGAEQLAAIAQAGGVYASDNDVQDIIDDWGDDT